MILKFRGLSKKGQAAFYDGAAFPFRINLTLFPGKVAPATLELPDGLFAASKQVKAKLTKEQRKALPKPTLAEQIAKRQANLQKMLARQAKEQAALAAQGHQEPAHQEPVSEAAASM